MSTTTVFSAATSVTPFLETVSPTPAVTTTPNPGGVNNGGMQKGANYFFGFLIAFIALLLVFVGCGVGTRRRFMMRRGVMGDWAGPASPYNESAPQKEPLFVESWLEKGGDRWKNMTPLSTTAIRPRPKTPEPSITPLPVTTLSSFRQLIPHPHFPFRRHLPPSTVVKQENSETTPSPESLAVTVMIAMPTQKSDVEHQHQEDEPLPEYSFGVAQVDWRGKHWISS
ncbi:hypothetical protein PC9H_008602 [Pleurotus ostreatus]|uniref:Transmembrane protein n=2 Tax=Pleurotus TaxID=5320 RepID=A0A8H6ZW37_PLEOS|nr:uncharacterized protein PC9H_008602 [Pleurotus ostreatus]KAF7426235.1 hypothetical protein PC9H_008602 [Pleurotus ostreatus]KAG9221608.1 hypothetical protein CCMSSC00406_0005521 [Pleurotus cornucopiae]